MEDVNTTYLRNIILEYFTGEQNTIRAAKLESDFIAYGKASSKAVYAIETRNKGTSKTLCSDNHFKTRELFKAIESLSPLHMDWIKGSYSTLSDRQEFMNKSIEQLIEGITKPSNQKKYFLLYQFAVINYLAEVFGLMQKASYTTIYKKIGIDKSSFYETWSRRYHTAMERIEALDNEALLELNKQL